MKLKNKKTGETGYYLHTHRDYKTGVLKVAVLKDGVPFSEFKPYEPIYDYDSLAELNEEWCDYEEPKGYWYIEGDGDIHHIGTELCDELEIHTMKQIGNYFDSREEAEKAVEKLKALTKLCKKGFEFNSVEMFGSGLIRIEASIPINEKTTLQERSNIIDSLYLLFGDEE